MNDAEHERLLRRHAELEILCDTVRDLSSTLSVQQVLSRLLERTLRHLDAEIGSILLIDADSVLRVVTARSATHSPDSPTTGISSRPSSSRWSGRSATSGSSPSR